MRTYGSGEAVPSGIYLSARHLDMRVVSRGDPALEGRPGARYWRVPLILVVLIGPLAGALFAMSFPVVIFCAFAAAAARHLGALRTWRAGEPARWGVYLGLNRPSLRYVGATREPLPGKPGTRYLRVPTLLLLLGSPLLGAAYLLLFPVIVAGAVLTLLGHAIAAPVRNAWERHAHLAHARWEPAAAYLAPPAGTDDAAPPAEPAAKPEQPADAEVDVELAELAAELEARRETERRGGGR